MSTEGVSWAKTDAEWAAAINRGFIVGMDAWLKVAVQRAKELAPVRSGRLFREIKQDPTTPYLVGNARVIGKFGVSGLAYAAAHEFGSGIHGEDKKPYSIRPRYATVLAFPWPNAPLGVKQAQPGHKKTGLFFFSMIQHPGVRAANQGKGYLRPAAVETTEEGGRLLAAALKAEMVL